MPVVQLFATCLVEGFAPEVGSAAVTVLERAGCDVRFPAGQTCCGQPAHNAGLAGDARAMAAHNVGVLDATEGPIVLPSGSCADMIIHHAPELLLGTEHEEPAGRVAGRVRELTQFLVDDLGVSDLGVGCDDCVLAYHPSCHGLRNLGIRAQPETLLDHVRGAQRLVPEEADQCCGFGGLFSVEMPEVSAAIMDAKIDDLVATGAEVLVGGDLSCLMHLAGGLRRRGVSMRVAHIAQILAGEI